MPMPTGWWHATRAVAGLDCGGLVPGRAVLARCPLGVAEGSPGRRWGSPQVRIRVVGLLRPVMGTAEHSTTDGGRAKRGLGDDLDSIILNYLGHYNWPRLRAGGCSGTTAVRWSSARSSV